MSAIKGLELAYKYYSTTGLNSSEDAFVVAFHSILLVFDFRCLGLMAENEENAVGVTAEIGSELLPENWNTNDCFAFKYVVKNDVFIVKMIKIMQPKLMLYVDVLRLKDNKIISIAFNVEDFITGDLSDFKKLYTNMDTLKTRVKDEIVDQIFPESKQSNPRVHRSEPEERERSSLYEPRRPRVDFRRDHFDDDPVRNIGRDDLDPFGRGGGMLLDRRDLMRPPRPDVGLPPGSVPPGARFDLVYPQGVGRGPRPNPDHLPPPGYDDMFG